jgi:EamA domain-containing membrane protein RarD
MRQAYFKMHIAIFLWGFTAIFGKLISLDEGMLVWYRMLLSSIATAIFLLATKNFKRDKEGFKHRHFKKKPHNPI